MSAPISDPPQIRHRAAVADLVARFVRKTQFRAVPTYGDAFAQKMAELAGDDVALDITERTLVAMKRQKILQGRRMVELLGRHQREGRNPPKP